MFLIPHIFLILITAFVSMSPQDARAEGTEICNETSYVMQFSLATQHSATTQSKGWQRIFPGDCDRIGEEIAADTFTYIFARSDMRAYIGDGIVISGNEPFCIAPPQEGFKIKGRENCRRRGYDEADFALVSGPINFSEAEQYERMRVLMAARQRLLDVLGFAPGPVDGYGGRRTRSATSAYLKSQNLPKSIEPSKLIRHLYETAIETYARRGLSLCNKTEHTVWAATGEPRGNGYRSAGWVQIEHNKCRQAITTPLAERYYYIYAEAVTKTGSALFVSGTPKRWQGEFALCTKPTRFVIDDHENCVERGLDGRRFLRIDTGNRLHWVFDLE